MINKTILLTGATGFLGSHILRSLLRQGYSVIVTKRLTSDTWRIKDLLDKVTVCNDKLDELEKIFAKNTIDFVIHLATHYAKKDNLEELPAMIDSNITFPTLLLELSKKYNVRSFINTGTFFEYESCSSPINEDKTISPFNLYAKTKVAFEEILKTYSKYMAISTFKIFSPYGEKDNNKLIPMVITKGLSNKTISLSGGHQSLDFIYVSDIVNAYLALLKKLSNEDFASPYQVFNLGTGQAISVRDLVNIIEKSIGHKLNVNWQERAAGDYDFVCADIGRIKEVLEWKPQVSIENGVDKTVSYYKGIINEAC